MGEGGRDEGGLEGAGGGEEEGGLHWMRMVSAGDVDGVLGGERAFFPSGAERVRLWITQIGRAHV